MKSPRKTPISRPYLLLTILYMAFLVSIIMLANHGYAREMFEAATPVFGGDKLAHAFLMGLFSFLLNSALRCRKTAIGPFRIMTGSLMAYLLVLAEEFAQRWQPRRSADPLDALFDVIGIIAFSALAEFNTTIKNNKSIEN